MLNNGVIVLAIVLSCCSIGTFSRKIAGVRGAVAFYEDSPRGASAVDVGFDYLMLTLIYPEAVCRADDDTVPDSCVIPDNTSKWTIHGLWPNFENGSYPAFCDGTPKYFDVDRLKLILEELKVSWPNLYPKKSQSSLWKHEWEKHGECSGKDPLLNSELKYFNSTLALHRIYNVEKALNDQGVLPSLDGYTYAQIKQGFKAGLSKGKNVQFNCLKDRKTKQTLLGDVRLCFDVNLKIRDCPDQRLSSSKQYTEGPLPSFSPCHGLITYLPSKNEEAIEIFSNVVIAVHPAAMVISIAHPKFALIVAVVILSIVVIALGKLNMELIAVFRRTVQDYLSDYRLVNPPSVGVLPKKQTV